MNGDAMPCCVYLGANELIKPTSDIEINSLLAQVRSATGKDYRVNEIVCSVPRRFRKPLELRVYELYSHVSDYEYQIVNFYRPDRDTSINHKNGAGYVAAYLYGILSSVEQVAQRGERT